MYVVVSFVGLLTFCSCSEQTLLEVFAPSISVQGTYTVAWVWEKVIVMIQTQNILKGLDIPSGLETPQKPQGEAKRPGCRETYLGYHA